MTYKVELNINQKRPNEPIQLESSPLECQKNIAPEDKQIIGRENHQTVVKTQIEEHPEVIIPE